MTGTSIVTARPNNKAVTPAAKPSALARKAGRAAKTMGEVGKQASVSLGNALRKEEPKTLAKIALAAVAPKLLESGLRFALRNPVTTMIGALVVSAFIWSSSENEGEKELPSPG